MGNKRHLMGNKRHLMGNKRHLMEKKVILREICADFWDFVQAPRGRKGWKPDWNRAGPGRGGQAVGT